MIWHILSDINGNINFSLYATFQETFVLDESQLRYVQVFFHSYMSVVMRQTQKQYQLHVLSWLDYKPEYARNQVENLQILEGGFCC